MDRKSSSLLMLAAAGLGGMGGFGKTSVDYLYGVGKAQAPRLPMRFMFQSGDVPTSRGHGRRNFPHGSPAGTFWRGDGVVPAETRQMRRHAEQRARKATERAR